jgi:predicted nucleic acid-binding Zn finger protein
MSFGIWDNSIHEHYEQLKRFSTALKGTLLDSCDCENESAVFIGSRNSTYNTTLNSCTCGDFLKRRLPCKHIYSLAITLGYAKDMLIFNKEAMNNFNIEGEITRFRNFYMSGAISAEKFAKIAEALSKEM